MSKQYVVIGLEDQRYCIPIELVGGVIDKFSVTIVPNSLNYVDGVTNIRGDIVPVISLKNIFNISDSKTNDTKLLNVILSGKNIGFVVDSASQVLAVDEENLCSMPKIATDNKRTYFDMVAKIEGELYIVLNPMELFGEAEKRELFRLIEEK